MSLYVNRLLSLLPNFLYPVKLFFIKKLLKEFGQSSKIPHDAYYGTFNNISIGKYVFINRDFFCSVKVALVIEDRVMFGANCSIIGGDHSYNDPNENMRFTKLLGDNHAITIESDSWIGHGTTILKNGNIGEGTIIAACSLITKPTKPYCVYAGHPAKMIHPRFETFEDLCEYLDMMEAKFSFTSKYNRTQLNSIIYEG